MAIYRPYSGIPTFTPADMDRFWSKVEKGAQGTCWPWTAGGDRLGYGMFKLDGRMWKAPRVAWLFTTTSDPAKMDVCHRCDNPPCVNPAHLFLGTASDNMRDCAAKGRLNFQNGQAGLHCKGMRGSMPRHSSSAATARRRCDAGSNLR